MALTLRKIYTDIALGKMRAKSGFIEKLNTSFDMPANLPSSGSVTVEMWDSFTTETPTAGNFLGQCANNILADLNVGLTSSTARKNEQQKDAVEFNEKAMEKIVLKEADAMKQDIQNAVIAGLKAAAAGLSITLPAGYADALLPSAATNPDVINNVIANLQRLIEFVKDQSGADADELVGVTTPTMKARLKAITLTPYRPPQLIAQGGKLFFDDVELCAVGTATNFGGAGNEALFILHPEGYACRYNEPKVTGNTPSGWSYGVDGLWRFTMQAPYVHGSVNTSFVGELVNP